MAQHSTGGAFATTKPNKALQRYYRIFILIDYQRVTSGKIQKKLTKMRIIESEAEETLIASSMI